MCSPRRLIRTYCPRLRPSSHPAAAARPLPHLDWIEALSFFIIGEQAMSRQLSGSVAARDPGSRDHLVPGAGHVGLYHRADLIPFDAATAFLARHLG